jgi:hypothetical protein
MHAAHSVVDLTIIAHKQAALLNQARSVGRINRQSFASFVGLLNLVVPVAQSQASNETRIVICHNHVSVFQEM